MHICGLFYTGTIFCKSGTNLVQKKGKADKVFVIMFQSGTYHMQNDSFKGKGYGTEAEKLAIKYAFDELGMVAVNADTAVKNTRSQHILEKIGFQFLKEEGDFRYYRLEKSS